MMMSNEYLDTMQAFFRNRPRLNNWQQQKADERKQSEAYYQAHPPSPQDQVRINEKMERILDATTVLDQASEQAAQTTEAVTDTIASLATAPIEMGLSLGSTVLATKVLEQSKGSMLGLVKYGSILAAGLLPIFAIEGLARIWAAQQETRASRIARREARQGELANPNRYALFTPKQKQIALQKASHISNEAIEAEEKAKNDKTDGFSGAFNQLNTLITDKHPHERDNLFKGIQKRLNTPHQAFSPQSEKELKEDAALVSNITRTINERSESYTENIENAYQTLSIGFTALVAAPLSAGVSYVLQKTKLVKGTGLLPQVASFLIPFLLLETPLIFLGNRLERDGARVARWKARQEIKKNPNALLAVPEQDKASVQGIKDSTFKSKGIADSFKQAFTLPFEFLKDHKAYQAWEKKEGLAEKKYRKALDQIQLSPQQMADAKRLQVRTHEAFNLTDEYSQESEMMEASTDTLKLVIQELSQMALMFPAIVLLLGHTIPLPKVQWLEKTAKLHGIEMPSSNGKKWEPLINEWRLQALTKTKQAQWIHQKATAFMTQLGQNPLKRGVLIPIVGGLAILLGPILLLNSIFTRWQKDSMRVGLMQADETMHHPNFFKL